MKIGIIFLILVLVVGSALFFFKQLFQASATDSLFEPGEDITMAKLSTLKPLSYQSRLMSESEKEEFRAVLKRLDAAILKKAPNVHEALSAPATDSEILEFRKAMGGAQIDALEILFKWHARSSKRGGTQLTFNGHYQGMESMLFKLHRSATFTFLSKKRRRSPILLHDYSGDGYFIDLSTQPPVVFFDWLETPGDENSGTLIEFFQFITEVWETVDITVNTDVGGVDFDDDLYWELDRKYQNAVNSSQ